MVFAVIIAYHARAIAASDVSHLRMIQAAATGLPILLVFAATYVLMIMDLAAVGLIGKILFGAVDVAQQRRKNEAAAENDNSSGLGEPSPASNGRSMPHRR